jgi:hypothetical protein
VFLNSIGTVSRRLPLGPLFFFCGNFLSVLGTTAGRHDGPRLRPRRRAPREKEKLCRRRRLISSSQVRILLRLPLPPSLSSSFLVVRLVRNYCFERQFLSRDIEGSNPILEGVVHLISIEHGESVICTLEVPSLSNRRFILDGLTAD